MKKLHLIRHAKSSWKDHSLLDIDRPLNKRGLKSCPVMAPQIEKAGCHFEHVYSSTATRAQLTIEHISHYLKKHDIQWTLDDALYTFDSQDLLTWCRKLSDTMSDVVIIGHNPALTDFHNEMSNRHLDNLPTCGYVQLAFECTSWKTITAGSAKQKCFLKPKMFM